MIEFSNKQMRLIYTVAGSVWTCAGFIWFLAGHPFVGGLNIGVGIIYFVQSATQTAN